LLPGAMKIDSLVYSGLTRAERVVEAIRQAGLDEDLIYVRCADWCSWGPDDALEYWSWGIIVGPHGVPVGRWGWPKACGVAEVAWHIRDQTRWIIEHALRLGVWLSPSFIERAENVLAAVSAEEEGRE